MGFKISTHRLVGKPETWVHNFDRPFRELLASNATLGSLIIEIFIQL